MDEGFKLEFFSSQGYDFFIAILCIYVEQCLLIALWFVSNKRPLVVDLLDLNNNIL